MGKPDQTAKTTVDVAAWLAALPDPRQRVDAVALAATMARLSGEISYSRSLVNASAGL